MAIKIIKEGKTGKFTKTCPYCGCEFEYGQEDIKYYGTYVICPCCGKHLHHNCYIAYYNHPKSVYTTTKTEFKYLNCDSCPNKPDPKNVITGDSPCDWCIKRQFIYK